MCVCMPFSQCVFWPSHYGKGRAQLCPSISYFKPQQSVMSTKTQPRINNRGRGGGDAWIEKKGPKRKKRGRRKFEKEYFLI